METEQYLWHSMEVGQDIVPTVASHVAAGRALVGIGAGAASLYVPRYVSEVSPVAVRGALATGNQVCLMPSCCPSHLDANGLP